MTEPEHDAFLDRCRRLLDTRVDTLPPALAMRLARARKTATSEGASPRRMTQRPVWLWASGAVAAVALAVAIFVGDTREPAVLPIAHADDLELMAASKDQMDLYDNLDFYRWLASDHNAS